MSRVHPGELPWKCAIPGCHAAFGLRCDLRSHAAEQHPSQVAVAQGDAADQDDGCEPYEADLAPRVDMRRAVQL